MASLVCSIPAIRTHLIIKRRFCSSHLHKVPGPPHKATSVNLRVKTSLLLCTKLFSLEPYGPADDENIIVKRSNVVEPIDTEDSPELASVQNEEEVIELKSQATLQNQPLKWPMWLLGPSVLLVTGMVPTLWLPLSSVFLGPNIAGLMALVGLDCIFNMGATLFLLMADSCARPKDGINLSADRIQVPLTYRLWNLGASIIGFIVPLLMLLALHRGVFEASLPFMSFAVLLGPYLLLLSTQMLTETLTWHWKSPVWLLTPIVYEAYRVLQLMRGLQLGVEISAPGWVMASIRGLVSWWVLVIGIQLMRVAWFAGIDLDLRATPQSQNS